MVRHASQTKQLNVLSVTGMIACFPVCSQGMFANAVFRGGTYLLHCQHTIVNDNGPRSTL